MRTKQQLQQATEANVKQVLATARERGWTPALIQRHGNPVVLAALGVATKAPKAPKAAPVAQQLAVQSTPKARKPKARAPRPSKPAFTPQGSVPVALVRGEERLTGTLAVGKERPKLLGTGTTTDAELVVGGATERCTLSPKAMQALLDDGTRLWFKGVSYIVTLA